MGFGLLFTGFILAANPVYYGMTAWAGYILMLMGLIKLSPYGRHFKTAKAVCCATLGIAVIALAYEVGSFFSLIDTASIAVMNFKTVLEGVRLIFELLFRLYLLLAIRDITKQTGLVKLYARSLWLIVCGGLYYVLAAARMVMGLLEAGSLYAPTAIAEIIVGAFWLVLFAFLIFRCYMWICLEGDELMEKKKRKKKTSDTAENSAGSISPAEEKGKG